MMKLFSEEPVGCLQFGFVISDTDYPELGIAATTMLTVKLFMVRLFQT